MLLSSGCCALETPHLDNTQTHISPLSRSSLHRKEAQHLRLEGAGTSPDHFPISANRGAGNSVTPHWAPANQRGSGLCAHTEKTSLRVNIWDF